MAGAVVGLSSSLPLDPLPSNSTTVGRLSEAMSCPVDVAEVWHPPAPGPHHPTAERVVLPMLLTLREGFDDLPLHS